MPTSSPDGRRLERFGMSDLAPASIPRLAPGCRISTAEGQEDLLLIPEGALRLKGPAHAIVQLCDGARSIGDIVGELKRRYQTDDTAQIEAEAVKFLSGLRNRGVIECA
jgi:pyrroloquinoline quinone biosynthesis protein D